MARSATGKTEGFTLIEVLVVVAIAGLVASLVVLNLGPWRSPSRPDAQLERLAALIDYQCEQALFQSRPRGIRLTLEGYDFWQASSQGWLDLSQDKVSRPRGWHDDPELELHVDRQRVTIEAEPEAPQLVCQPLGELSAFTLTLRLDSVDATLSGESNGRLALERTQ